jgi:hypothetical protein
VVVVSVATTTTTGQPAAPGSTCAPQVLECGQGVKEIYHSCNGEIETIDEEEYEKFEEIVMDEEQQSLLVHEEGDEHGHFADVVYAVPSEARKNGLTIYVERTWIPSFGYSWCERQILKLEVW